GVHALVAANVSAPATSPDAASSTVAYTNAMHVTLERRPPAAHRNVPAHAPAHVPAAQLEVVHNVVTLHRPAAPAVAAVPHAAALAKPAPSKNSTHVRQTVVAMAPTERDERSISALKTSATAIPPAARAESMAMVPNITVVRDAMPLGGENAIVPHPALIAYNEGAEGTTAFEVVIDDKGAPVKCTITKPSGFLVL